MSELPRLSIVVAVDQHHLIGREGELPWRLPADLKRFKATTWGKPLLMGRRTHESIGRPLPGRTNIILTRRVGYAAPGCLVAGSVSDALELVVGEREVMVIGGAGVYAECLPRAHTLHLTVVQHAFEGDVYFPHFDLTDWTIADTEHIPANDRNRWAHSVYRLTRRVGRAPRVIGSGPGPLPEALRIASP